MSISTILASGNFITTSKPLVRYFGSIEAAAFLAYLLGQRELYAAAEKLTPSGAFFCAVSKVKAELCLDDRAQKKLLESYTKEGLLTYSREGVKGRRHILFAEDIDVRLTEMVSVSQKCESSLFRKNAKHCVSQKCETLYKEDTRVKSSNTRAKSGKQLSLIQQETPTISTVAADREPKSPEIGYTGGEIAKHLREYYSVEENRDLLCQITMTAKEKFAEKFEAAVISFSTHHTSGFRGSFLSLTGKFTTWFGRQETPHSTVWGKSEGDDLDRIDTHSEGYWKKAAVDAAKNNKSTAVEREDFFLVTPEQVKAVFKIIVEARQNQQKRPAIERSACDQWDLSQMIAITAVLKKSKPVQKIWAAAIERNPLTAQTAIKSKR